MLTLTTAPSATLLDLTTVKAHVGVADETDFDALLPIYMHAAEAIVEKIAGRRMITQTWQYTTGALVNGWRIDIDDGPNMTLTKVEVLSGGSYVDVTSVSKMWQITEGYSRVAPQIGQSWPAPDLDDAAYRVTYTVGYGAAASNVPPPLFAAALLITGDLFTNRESKVQANMTNNPTVFALIGPYRAPGL